MKANKSLLPSLLTFQSSISTMHYSLLTISCSLFTVICSLYTATAQDKHLVDSLEAALKTHNATKLELQIKSPSLYDTTAANILYYLSKAYWGNNPDKAMNYANQLLALSEQISYKKGLGNAYNSMGAIAMDKGNYLPALELYEKALKLREEIGDKEGIANSYNNIGVIYHKQGNYPEAIENFFAALKIREEIGDKIGIAISYNNIGSINLNQGNYPEALKNYLACLKIMEEIGYKEGIATTYNNIGIIYYKEGNYPEALKNYLASLKIREEIGYKQGIATSYTNIGSIYGDQGNYPKALKNFLASLKIEEEIGDKEGIANSYNNIGVVYTKQKKFKEATEYLHKGLSLSTQMGALKYVMGSYDGLASLDSAQGNFKQALEHYKSYITYRDSLVNNENTLKTTQQEMQYEFGKKQDSLNVVQANKDVVAQKELQKQKLVRNSFVGGFAVVLLFAGVFFRQRNKTKREKKKSEELLLNILPAEVAEEIKSTGTAKAKAFTMVTVMFTDFKDFTTVSEKVSAELLVDEIHTCFSAFDNILHKYKIEKIKTIGDAYLCASGLPVSNYTHAVDMLNAAFEIRSYMMQRKKEKEVKGEIPFELRIGIHTGPVVAGVVGVKKYAYDIWGDTVNIAARMEQNSEAGKINISGSTYELVKNKFNCEYRGEIEAKGKGQVKMYFVTNGHVADLTAEESGGA